MIIKDVIHRFVNVPELCQKFMDTPEFNRLKRIKQLGLAHYVYPSATHTRFEHSIGVMHIAGKIATNLNFETRRKELLQLAALFHDSGHTAFSHLMDYILEEKKFPDHLAKHEYRSIAIIKRINSRLKLLTENEEQIIAKMILGDTTETNEPILFEIVNNSVFGLDVDRLDYLQRDMYHTGMPCFQADYIIESIQTITIDKKLHLALRKKAKVELEMMYEARRRLLTIICRHSTVMKVENIIRQILEKFNITQEWFEQNWLKLDDYRMYCMMEDICPELTERLATRNWDNIDENDRFKHIRYISKEEIANLLEKVFWID